MAQGRDLRSAHEPRSSRSESPRPLRPSCVGAEDMDHPEVSSFHQHVVLGEHPADAREVDKVVFVALEGRYSFSTESWPIILLASSSLQTSLTASKGEFPRENRCSECSAASGGACLAWCRVRPAACRRVDREIMMEPGVAAELARSQAEHICSPDWAGGAVSQAAARSCAPRSLSYAKARSRSASAPFKPILR